MTAPDDYPASPATRGKLDVGGYADGVFERGYDSDWYAIYLNAGEPVLFSLVTTTGYVPYSTGYGAYAITVYNGDRKPMVGELLGGDYNHPVLDFTAPVSGTYYVAALSEYVWDALGGYRLSAAIRTAPDDNPASAATTAFLPEGGQYDGRFEVAGDQDWIRFHATAGTHYRFTADGPGPGEVGDKVFPEWIMVVDAHGNAVQPRSSGFDPAVSGDYYLHVLGLAEGDYSILSQAWKDDYPGTNATRAELAPSAPARGLLEYEGDVDRFHIRLEAGKFYKFTLTGDLNYYALNLRDRAGVSLTDVSGNNDHGLQLMFHPGASGDYYLDVRHVQQTLDQQGALAYAVSVGAPVDDDIGDTAAGAATLSVGVVGSGTLQASIDTDQFRVALEAGSRYAVVLRAADGTRDDLGFSFSAADGTLISRGADDFSGYSRMLTYTPTASGDYYIGVSTGTWGTHDYRLQVIPLSGDTAAPLLMAASHVAGASGIPIDNDTLTLTFNEPIAIGANAVSLKNSAGKNVYFSYDDQVGHGYPFVNGNQVIVKLSEYFTPGTYTLSIDPQEVRDLAGNVYAGPQTFTFSTVQPVSVGGSGNDLLLGGGGKLIDGGAGLDTVSYGAGSYRDGYDIVRGGAGVSVTSFNSGKTDVLVNVERLLFNHLSFALDIDGHAGQAYRLYQAAFDRKPDLVGLGYWIKQMDQGLTLQAVANNFVLSAEFQQRYGPTLSDADFVTLMYNNVLHRAPEQAGFDYWTGGMQHGLERSTVLLCFSESQENQAALATVIGNGFVYTPYYG